MSNEREFVGRKGWRVEGVRYRGSFDYAQDRLFALERRAQDDSKNKQRRGQGRIRRFWLRQNDGAAWGMTNKRTGNGKGKNEMRGSLH
jgi:hypothetical protein